jgi:hypothetical protein
MAHEPLYVLGVDGLPLGTHAAAASGSAVLVTFAVVDQAGAAWPLELRVQEAVAHAEEVLGTLPSEVRLVCYDDGVDGSELARIAAWLDGAGGMPLLLLDAATVEEGGADPGGASGGAGQDPARLSVGRARHAALS